MRILLLMRLLERLPVTQSGHVLFPGWAWGIMFTVATIEFVLSYLKNQ